MPSLECCGVRALWAFTEEGELLYSRRFPVVERQWRLLSSATLPPQDSPVPGAAYNQPAASLNPPLFDAQVFAALKQALAGSLLLAKDGSGPPEDGGDVSGFPIWRLGDHALVLVAGLCEPRSSSGCGAHRAAGGAAAERYELAVDGTPQPEEERGSGEGRPGEAWPLLVARTGGRMVVVMCPLIPELLNDPGLVERAVNRELGNGQSCWPDAHAAESISLTASLELLDSMAACLPSAPISHPPGSKQHSREVDACSAALRSFVGSVLPLGSYTGARLSGETSGEGKSRPQLQQQQQSQAGGGGPDSLLSAWAHVPRLAASGTSKHAQQRLQLCVAEEVDASLPSLPPAGSDASLLPPTPAALAEPCLRVRGRLEVAVEGKALSKLDIPLASSSHALKDLTVDHCLATTPPLAAGQPASQVTLSLAPPPSKAFVAAHFSAEPPVVQPPFTGHYSVKPKPGSDGKVLCFSVELLYHSPDPQAVVELCTVTLGMPHLVSSLDGTTASIGAVTVQDGRVVWQNIGAGRINARSTRANCSGTATLMAAPSSLPSAEVDISPAGLSLQQSVAGCRPARVSFLVKGATLSGININRSEVATEPLHSKDMSVEYTAELRSGSFTIWSLP